MLGDIQYASRQPIWYVPKMGGREVKVSEILSTAATRAAAFFSAMCAILRWCAAAKLSIACFMASEKIYTEGSTGGDEAKVSVSTAIVPLRVSEACFGESVCSILLGQ